MVIWGMGLHGVVTSLAKKKSAGIVTRMLYQVNGYDVIR